MLYYQHSPRANTGSRVAAATREEICSPNAKEPVSTAHSSRSAAVEPERPKDCGGGKRRLGRAGFQTRPLVCSCAPGHAQVRFEISVANPSSADRGRLQRISDAAPGPKSRSGHKAALV